MFEYIGVVTRVVAVSVAKHENLRLKEKLRGSRLTQAVRIENAHQKNKINWIVSPRDQLNASTLISIIQI